MRNEKCIYNSVCENDCKESCLRYAEMQYMLDNSGIPKARQKFNRLIPQECDLQAFTNLAKIQSDIERWVKDGCNLYLYSDNCGNGKTTWSIKLMLQYFHEKWAGNGFIERGLFIHVPSFINAHKNNMTKTDDALMQTISYIPKVDLIIWDDIASTKLTDYEFSLILSYLDGRILNCKSNIFTGNIQPQVLGNQVGERLSSRILCGKCIELKGGDNRYGADSMS